jgi:hypothetical protein
MVESPRNSKQNAREARLRAALRENLKRRKVQALRRAGGESERPDQKAERGGPDTNEKS